MTDTWYWKNFKTKTLKKLGDGDTKVRWRVEEKLRLTLPTGRREEIQSGQYFNPDFYERYFKTVTWRFRLTTRHISSLVVRNVDCEE